MIFFFKQWKQTLVITTETIVALLLKIAQSLVGKFIYEMTPGGEAEFKIEGFKKKFKTYKKSFFDNREIKMLRSLQAWPGSKE